MAEPRVDSRQSTVDRSCSRGRVIGLGLFLCIGCAGRNVIESEFAAPVGTTFESVEAVLSGPDIGAVMHSHAMFCTMFALVNKPIPCVIEEFDVYVGGDVRVADYEMTGSDQLGNEAARHLGDRGAVLIANHGLLAVGKNPKDVLKVSLLVERTAQIVWGAQLLGDIVPLPDDTLKKFAPLYKMMGRLRV